jgi:hypothetical protein
MGGRELPRMFRRLLMSLLVAGFVGCILWQVWIHLTYDLYMPRSPEVNTGRIHRLVVNHGVVVYINETELGRADFVLDKLIWIEMPLFAAIGFLHVYTRERAGKPRV